MAAPTPVGFVLGFVAAGAWLVAVYSAFRAWRLSERHAPYRALGLKRFIGRMGALKLMPPEARVHLRRYCYAVAVFFAVLVAAIATGVISARS